MPGTKSDGQKHSDSDLAELSTSELETLVNLQEALDKLDPNEHVEGGEVYIQGSSQEETGNEVIIHSDDPLLSNVVMSGTAEGEVITGDTEEESSGLMEAQQTYMLIQQSENTDAKPEIVSETRTQDGNIILRPISSSSHLQGIRPMQTTIKRPAHGSGQTVTKVIITGGNQPSGVSQPVLFSTASNTSQSIKFITTSSSSAGGSGATMSNTTGPRTISLAQAQQMGLISPSKIAHVGSGNKQQNIIVSKMLQQTKGSPKITMVQGGKSPTKILPAPGVSPQLIKPAVASVAQINSQGIKTLGGPQKVIIRHAGATLQGGLKAGTLLSGSGGPQLIRIPATQNVPGAVSNELQTLQLQSGKQFQYLRLVTNSQNTTTSTTLTANLVPISSRPMQGTSNQTLKMVPIAPAGSGSGIRSVAPKTPGNVVSKKIMIPATLAPTSQIRTSSGGQVNSSAMSQLGGTLVPTAGGNYMVLPAQIYDQIQGQVVTTPHTKSMTPKEAKSTPRSTNSEAATPSSRQSRPSLEPNGLRPRKPCNCTKSQCLKLYCDCFANGEFCNSCNCNCCYNNLEHEEDRQKAIRACLERNPQAFRPKIGKTQVGDERRHNKGCNCRRSGCLKNYCECYEAKIPCTHMCKCIGCRNVEDNMEHNFERDTTIVPSGPRARQHLFSISTPKAKSSTSKRGRGAAAAHQGITRQPFGFVNQRLVDASCQCLLAQAQHAESDGGFSEAEIERQVLEEYGECLKQLIECSSKLGATL